MSSRISGIEVMVFVQKIDSEKPRAIEGTAIGMLTRMSKKGDNAPSFLLAIAMAIGNPMIMFSTVTVAASAYERIMLCQYCAQMPVPCKDSVSVFVKVA